MDGLLLFLPFGTGCKYWSLERIMEMGLGLSVALLSMSGTKIIY